MSALMCTDPDSSVNGMWFISTSQSIELSEYYAPVICNHGPYGAREQCWYWLFSLQSPGICLALQEHFYDQSPTKRPGEILVCKCEITLAVWAWESKSPPPPMSVVPRHCRDNAEVKTWHLTPAMSPAPVVPGLHPWGRESDQSSLCTQRVRSGGGPKLSSCDSEDWSDWANA